jgi:hypothetical protein
MRTFFAFATAWYLTMYFHDGDVVPVASAFVGFELLTAFYVVHRAARLDGVSWAKSLGLVVATDLEEARE